MNTNQGDQRSYLASRTDCARTAFRLGSAVGRVLWAQASPLGDRVRRDSESNIEAAGTAGLLDRDEETERARDTWEAKIRLDGSRSAKLAPR